MCTAKARMSMLLALGYLGYLLAGAAVFQALEQKAEQAVKNRTQRHKLAFLRNFTCLSQEDLERLVAVIIEATQQGIYPLSNESLLAEHSNWDFSSSFFFVGSTVTTIGYGTLAPRTAGGQIFCVIYALFGIPLNIIVLGHVSKTLSLLCERLGRCLSNKGMEKKKVKLLTMLFFLVTGIIAFLGIPPIFFMNMEGWNYREGVYYAFISLSTIGFGDYVVGSHPDRKYYRYYRALVAIWIIFGLAWLALLFNLLTACLEDTEKKIAKDFHKKVKAGKGKERASNAAWHTSSGPETEDVLLDTGGAAPKVDAAMADPSDTWNEDGASS
ncbi:potassium channel subfamily K member 16-like [Rhinatrema bivittatum]|uniref:potassium channel subfamily K member 16-like n=1 Tax=Rhinatrema bivittatum TaxID=194408 RepID=UPI00112CFDA1|nr:potassium channel subfamily K member 16-like [Rhinatrema bivittatum]